MKRMQKTIIRMLYVSKYFKNYLHSQIIVFKTKKTHFFIVIIITKH